MLSQPVLDVTVAASDFRNRRYLNEKAKAVPDDKQEPPYLAKWAVVITIVLGLITVAVAVFLNRSTPTFGGVSQTSGTVIQATGNVIQVGSIVQQFKTTISNTLKYVTQADFRTGPDTPSSSNAPPSAAPLSERAGSEANAVAGALSASGGPAVEAYANDPSFLNVQGRDDYNLRRQHLAHLHRSVDRFFTDQVVVTGHAIREQRAAARETERQRLERIAEQKARAGQDAERRAALHAANAAREEAERRDAINSRNQQLAEQAGRISFARSYMGAMQDVAAQEGSPCDIQRSDTAGYGHTEMWIYGCSGSHIVIYTFVNGKLTSHSY